MDVTEGELIVRLSDRRPEKLDASRVSETYRTLVLHAWDDRDREDRRTRQDRRAEVERAARRRL